MIILDDHYALQSILDPMTVRGH